MPQYEEWFEIDSDKIRRRVMESTAWMEQLSWGTEKACKDSIQIMLDRVAMLGYETGLLFSALAENPDISTQDQERNTNMMNALFAQMLMLGRKSHHDAIVEADRATTKH